ncbi:hypothetical protein J4E91_001586 [Alternaria rosae]|nr:hypothetical protein J4E91_001586 [Alternaria rosae]
MNLMPPSRQQMRLRVLAIPSREAVAMSLNDNGAAESTPNRSPSINDGRSQFGSGRLNSASANAGGQTSAEDFNTWSSRKTIGVHGNTIDQPRQSAVYQPSLGVPQDERSQRDADQAIDESPSLRTEQQAGPRVMDSTKLSFGQDDAQPVPKATKEESSTMSLPTRSASSISSSRDMLRYAVQNQSGQSNRMTATLRPKRTETQAAEPTPTEVDTATRPHITRVAANTDMETRIKALEDQQNDTRDTVDALEQLYIRLKESVNHLEYQNTLQPAHRQAPSSSTTGFRTPADDGSFNVPLQGDLSDESFAFIIKMFAGQKINADHCENVAR